MGNENGDRKTDSKSYVGHRSLERAGNAMIAGECSGATCVKVGVRASLSPQPIGPREIRRRQSVALRIARELGFVGRVEYRHVHSQSGGAQYGRGAAAGSDLLTVYAEAFARDADPSDFSLSAIIAHERGHQLLARHPRLSVLLASASAAAEEVLASLLGALVLKPGPERDTLLDKAAFELLTRGANAETTERTIAKLWDQLGRLL